MVILNDDLVDLLKDYINAVNDSRIQDVMFAGYKLAAALDVALVMGEKKDDTEK